MKQKFVSPTLTAFGRMEKITTEFGDNGPEDREREERIEEGGDDIESIGVVQPDLEED